MRHDWPAITVALINKLDEICPERCPSPDETLEDIHHYSGKREMVRFLIKLHEEQINKVT